MSALKEFIKSEVYQNAKEELERMQSRLDAYKGDKQPFERTIEVFTELLRSNASFRIDWVLMSAENSKLETEIIMLQKEKKELSRTVKKLEIMMENGSRQLTTEEMKQVSEMIKKEFVK